MNFEILRLHEDYVTRTKFYLNVTEWFTSPGVTKFSKPIKKMSEDRGIGCFLKRFCISARKKDGTQFTKVHQ